MSRDMEDPYFDVTEARREEREAHEEKIVGDGAFIPSGYPQVRNLQPQFWRDELDKVVHY